MSVIATIVLNEKPEEVILFVTKNGRRYSIYPQQREEPLRQRLNLGTFDDLSDWTREPDDHEMMATATVL